MVRYVIQYAEILLSYMKSGTLRIYSVIRGIHNIFFNLLLVWFCLFDLKLGTCYILKKDVSDVRTVNVGLKIIF